MADKQVEQTQEELLRGIVRSEIEAVISSGDLISKYEVQELIKAETSDWKHMLNNLGTHVGDQINGLIDSVAGLTGKIDKLIDTSKEINKVAQEANEIAKRANQASEKSLEVSNQALQASSNSLTASNNALTAARLNTEAIHAWAEIHTGLQQDVRELRENDEKIEAHYHDMDERTDLNIKLGKRNSETIEKVEDKVDDLSRRLTPMELVAQRQNERHEKRQKAKEAAIGFVMSKQGASFIGTLLGTIGLSTGAIQDFIQGLKNILSILGG